MTLPASAATAPPVRPDLATNDGPPPEGQISTRTLAGTTPARMRLLSLATLAALVVLAVIGWIAARGLTTNTDRAVENTGPVLVATQDVFASIAEADAASAAVFLSGTDEDREQRRLYELALERASAQLEEVSRLIGDSDADHDSLKVIAADLTTYSGEVEAARLANKANLAGATAQLESAIDIVQDSIVPQVQAITTSTQDRLDDDIAGGRGAVVLMLAVALLVLLLLVWSQVFLTRRTNRVINPPLAMATVLTLVCAIWLLTAWVRQQDALEVATEGGYDSIALTADIQTRAFRYKTLESLSLVSTGDPAEQQQLATELAAIDLASNEVIAAARTGNVTGEGLLLDANRAADSSREQAATAEMLTRWDRYLETSQDIQLALDADDRPTANALAIGPANADFNGFNTSVESVLSDNRTQFTDGLARAREHLDWLPLALVALPLIAAGAALWGFELRIREYRR